MKGKRISTQSPVPIGPNPTFTSDFSTPPPAVPSKTTFADVVSICPATKGGVARVAIEGGVTFFPVELWALTSTGIWPVVLIKGELELVTTDFRGMT